MILRNDAHPHGLDMGARTTGVNVLSGLNGFRPMHDGGTWHDKKSSDWLKRPRGPRKGKVKSSVYRLYNLEHNRALERARSQRRRAAVKAARA